MPIGSNPFKKLNREMKLFLLRLVVIIILWQTLYFFILKPNRIPDSFLTESLTRAVTGTLNVFFSTTPPATWVSEPAMDACNIQQNGKTILVIFDDCNGLDLFIIYITFIFLLPYPLKRKLLFSAGGLVAIFIGNILRCVALYYVYVHFRGSFEFNHHYVFTIIMYLIMFFGWILFTKKPRLNEVS